MQAKTSQASKTMSLWIMALVTQGKPMREAIDEVFGCGAFENLASDVYESLRAKAQAN